MMIGTRGILSLMLILSLTVLAACGDDDPAGPGGTTDTTAPQSVGNDPTADDSDVAVDEQIRVTFNEPMKTSSATGNVTLSAGTITNLGWENANRTLVIDHTDWLEGQQVTVTIGADLEDAAGNKLGANYVFSFWTQTAQVEALAMNPADGAVGVDRNTLISLLFSRRMNLGSLDTAITVSDATKVDYTFTILGDENGWVALQVDGTLPASTVVTVVVSTEAQDEFGNFLSSAASFQFTTGVDIDDTPPTLVSAEPPSGSIISPNQGFLRLTFSEPMDPTLFEPSRINAEFLLLVNEVSEPTWSENYTVLTVPLPTPLAAGTPMEVEFATLTDRNGVVQTTPTTWTAKVSGTPDYFPVVDGARSYYFEFSQEGDIGSPADTGNEEFLFVQFETQGSGVFHWTYYDPTFTMTESWDIYRKSSSEVAWVGLHETIDGVTEDITISPGVRMVQIPPKVGSWVVDSSASDGTDTFDVNGQGETLGQEDIPFLTQVFKKDGFFGKAEPVVFWKDAWKIQLSFEVSFGSQVFFTSARTMWFAANIGLVQAESYDEELGDTNRWDRTETYWIPFFE